MSVAATDGQEGHAADDVLKQLAKEVRAALDRLAEALDVRRDREEGGIFR